MEPAWCHWQGGTVVNLARRIREERVYTDLPVLADALEEAGCTSAEILGHLRGASPHPLGCWVVEMLLAASKRLS